MEDRFLVTGATGFVGACIVRELVRQKKHVSIIVRDRRLNWRLHDIASLLDIYECDLLDANLGRVINKITPIYIFHLAAYGSLPEENDVRTLIDVNINGTLNLINALKENKFKLFVNTGSSSEYGVKNTPMNEEDLPRPVNDYGVVKAAVTLFCQKIAQTESLPIITFRLFSPYGYFEEKSRLVSSVVLNAINDHQINLFSPANVRDFIFIEDVMDAYLKSIEHNFTPGTIVNIASGEQHSVEEIVRTVLQITKSASKINWGKIPKQERQIEPNIWVGDILRAKEVLRWKPKHSLEAGLKKTIAWFRKYKRWYD